MANDAKSPVLDTDMDVYQYLPLPLSEPHIRLIELPPGKNSGVVTCRIAHHPLAQAPKYEAVSHCWGDPEDKATIEILADDTADDGTGPPRTTRLAIPGNLNAFLLRTRAKGAATGHVTRTLWADAVCINQADAAEKGAQVRLMRDIYRGAARTLVWLGPAAHDSARGIAFAKRIVARAQGDRSGETRWARLRERLPGYRTTAAVLGRDWRAFFALFDRPYFARAWIVQEIAVSAALVVVCGDAVVGWRPLIAALWHVCQRETWILEFFEQNRTSSIWLLQSQYECAQRLPRAHYPVLARHRPALATDPRDHVFSFYGLACHQSFVDHAIEPRYDLPAGTVYTNVAVATLRRVANLDFLCIPRLSRDPGPWNLPSWVPDWSRAEPVCLTMLGLESGEPIADSPEASLYTATRGSTYTPTIDEARLTLELSGYVIDAVAAVSARWIAAAGTGFPGLRAQAAVLRGNQRLVHDWETLLGVWTRATPYPTDEAFEDVVWQTLVAGNLAAGSGKAAGRAAWDGFQRRQRFLRWPPRLGLQDALWAWALVVVVGHVLHFFGVRNPEIPFRTMTGVMMGRRAMRTASGYVGLAPGIAEPGDRIVLLRGGRLPFVLRERGDKTWELIGDCYVHGIMAGEKWGEECESFIVA